MEKGKVTKGVATKKPVARKSAALKKEVAATKAQKPKRGILFVASECMPYAGTGGLGEVVGSLPAAINALKGEYEASVILPLYEEVSQEYRNKMKLVLTLDVPLLWRSHYCGLYCLEEGGVKYYFVDNEQYFRRGSIYGYHDDGERFAYFSRAVCEVVLKLENRPEILHCNDWHTALVPIYFNLYYKNQGLENIKTAFTIHNIEYQGRFARNTLEEVFGLPDSVLSSLEFDGNINLVKGAMEHSDSIVTVSRTYATELEDSFYAHGLENVVKVHRGKMRGILNGINVDLYNPQKNPSLFKNYSLATIKDKTQNKTELQRMLNLEENPNVPIVAMITRLVSHKGLDLVRFAMEDILKGNLQLVILGKGEPEFENYFEHIAQVYNNKVAAVIAFDRDLSHKVYAAADIFLMPSKQEPCGLSQMMACRYGSVPVVRATGGLRDSIQDADTGDIGNGFVFENYNAADMMKAINRAVGLYHDYRDKWANLVARCMKSDFSWKHSAKEYVKFFNELKG